MLEPMGRPTSRPELLAAAEQEFDRLWDAVRGVSPSDRETPGACDSWSVKDILAHLDAWHRMWLRWEQAGARGEPSRGAGLASTRRPETLQAVEQQVQPELEVQQLGARHRQLGHRRVSKPAPRSTPTTAPR